MTGPITLFDKSFLQSLNLDESVWFDHFFLTNVCPLFYVETLADLGKPVNEGPYLIVRDFPVFFREEPLYSAFKRHI